MARKKKKVDTKIEMDMTPMIDVTFQLLIFFIVTMKFRLLEKKLLSHLPTDFGLNSSSEIVDENFVTVKLRQRVDKPGKRLAEQSTVYYIESDEITGVDKADIHAKILKRISEFRSRMGAATGDPDKIIGKIDAGTGVPHQEVVSVLDLYHAAKFKSISFVGLTATTKLTEGEAKWNQLRNELTAPVNQ